VSFVGFGQVIDVVDFVYGRNIIMPLRGAWFPGDTVIFRNASGQSSLEQIKGGQAPASMIPTPVGVGSASGGTLAAATYAYKITAVIGSVESAPSSASTGTVTSGSTSSITVSWAAVPGATSYKVYGRTGGSFLLMNTVTAPTVQYVDTNADTPSGATPIVNQNISFRGRLDKVSRTGILPGMGANQYEKRI
jgi:hypothetical protein